MALTFVTDINPFTYEVAITARIDGLEHRASITYDPLTLFAPVYFDLAGREWSFWIEYDETPYTRIIDEEGQSYKTLIKFSGLR